MADELLIRVYDVGLGDCILCRIPGAVAGDGAPADFHVLIDCGSWSGRDRLDAALADIAATLPRTADGKARLDLLVVTHEHKDHISGFDPSAFGGFSIGAIWMSAAMDPDHPQAERTRRLNALSAAAMRSLAASGLALDPDTRNLVDLFSIDNDGAMDALRNALPAANGIRPTYVHAGQSNDDLGLPLEGAAIHVLGPEADIDRFYLGRTARRALAAVGDDGFDHLGVAPDDGVTDGDRPATITAGDFRRLRERMLSNALAFAALSGKVTNNSSVVLLVEWKGRRLLFTGDAEWEAAYEDGRSNGAWNVMWHQRRRLLDAPVDFLKVGHHGSENATPWHGGGSRSFAEPAAILDAILPLRADGAATAAAVVSTARGRYPTIPRSELLVEIGRRVGNARIYADRFAEAGRDPARDLPDFEGYERSWLDRPQPERTDVERILSGAAFIEVAIPPRRSRGRRPASAGGQTRPQPRRRRAGA